MVESKDITEEAEKEVREANRLRDAVADEPYTCGNFGALMRRVAVLMGDSLELMENKNDTKFPDEVMNAWIIGLRRAESAGCLSKEGSMVLDLHRGWMEYAIESGDWAEARHRVNAIRRAVSDGGAIKFEPHFAELSCERSIDSPKTAIERLMAEHGDDVMAIGTQVDNSDPGADHFEACAMLKNGLKR